MITYERKLTSGESSDLQDQLQDNSTRQRKALRTLLIWPLTAILIAAILKASLLVYTSLFILGLLISFGINSKFHRKRKQLQSLLQKGTVTVTNIQANNYLFLPDYEGEGDHYIFQLDNNLLLLIGGEEYEEYAEFPHEQNEIIAGLDNNNTLVYFDIIFGGQPVNPIAEISELDKMDLLNRLSLTDYAHYATASGKLEDLLPK